MKIAEILFKSGATKEIKCEDGEAEFYNDTGKLKKINLINAEGYGYINVNNVDCVLFKELLKMDLGENIKKYRKQKGLTQKDLASKVGVTASTITKYEKGDLEPSLDTIKKIANVLDVPMATIIGDDLEIGFQAHIKGYADDVDSYYKSPSKEVEDENN